MGGDDKRRERKSGASRARALAERERADTSFTPSAERPPVSGAFPAAPERRRVTEKIAAARPGATQPDPLGRLSAQRPRPSGSSDSLAGGELTPHQQRMLASAFQVAAKADAVKQ